MNIKYVLGVIENLTKANFLKIKHIDFINIYAWEMYITLL